MEFNIAIVAIAFNRQDSLMRLLKSLKDAKYKYEVSLIISIDFSPDIEAMKRMADDFKWNHGPKIVIAHEQNLGLRNHILECGDLTNKYDAVVMFEDDIVASPYYFDYIDATLKEYGNSENVAGISLYKPDINEMVDLPFSPINNGFDIYFHKSASSWGQCWNRRMWSEFRSWYDRNKSDLVNEEDMPSKIYSWSNKSWKKYFMKYLVVNNKYFIYPYISLSTNMSEVGSHVINKSSAYQVPLLMGEIQYKFPIFSKSIRYDQYYENENLESNLELGDHNTVMIDLYGSKQNYTGYDFILTTKNLNLELIKSYGLSFKPIEMNVIFNNIGDQIKLYRNKDSASELVKNRDKFSILQYYSSLTERQSIIYGLEVLKKKVLNKIKK